MPPESCAPRPGVCIEGGYLSRTPHMRFTSAVVHAVHDARCRRRSSTRTCSRYSRS